MLDVAPTRRVPCAWTRALLALLLVQASACDGPQPGLKCPGTSAQNPDAQGFGFQCPLNFATAQTSLCALGLPNSIYRSTCDGGYQLVAAVFVDSSIDCYYGADGQLVAVIQGGVEPRPTSTCVAGPVDFVSPACGKGGLWC